MLKEYNQGRLLTTQQAANLLNITPHALQVWRTTKRYPLPYVKVGSCVRYKESDLESFIAKRTEGDAHE